MLFTVIYMCVYVYIYIICCHKIIYNTYDTCGLRMKSRFWAVNKSNVHVSQISSITQLIFTLGVIGILNTICHFLQISEETCERYLYSESLSNFTD